MMYRLYSTNILEPQNVNAAMTVGVLPQISFIFDPANTDFANFKKEVLAGAELQDSEGQVMSQEEANQFIASLP